MILAIDPSLASTGIAVLNHQKEIQYITTIKTKPDESIGKRLSRFCEEIEKMIDTYKIDLVLTEFNYSGGSKEVNWVLGNIFRITEERDIRIVTYAPATVKKVCSGSGRATKADMKQAIIKIYGDMKSNEHIRDALGVAHCYFEKKEED